MQTYFIHKKRFYILALFLGIFCSCENDKNEVELVTRKSNFPVESAGNIEVLYSDSARVKVKMTAPVMNRYATDKPYLEMPKGIDLKFFDNDMHVISTLTANYAVRRDQENIMEAKNNVVVVNQKGEQLNTEHLIWNEKTRKIYSDVFAKITTKDEIIYGNGFEANEDFSKYKINQVKGIITVNKEKNAAHP